MSEGSTLRATLKNTLKRQFSQIPNALIEDSSLSDRARFVFCYMASRPDNWKFYNKQLAKSFGYTVETLRKYVDELIVAGWVVKSQQDRGERGKFTNNHYELLSSPVRNLPYPKKTDTVKDRDGKNHALNNKDLEQQGSLKQEGSKKTCFLEGEEKWLDRAGGWKIPNDSIEGTDQGDRKHQTVPPIPDNKHR